MWISVLLLIPFNGTNETPAIKSNDDDIRDDTKLLSLCLPNGRMKEQVPVLGPYQYY